MNKKTDSSEQFAKPRKLEVTIEQAKALINRVEQKTLEDADYPLIVGIICSVVWLSLSLDEKKLTIIRLKKIFGSQTERTRNLPIPKPDEKTTSQTASSSTTDHSIADANSTKNGSMDHPNNAIKTDGDSSDTSGNPNGAASDEGTSSKSKRKGKKFAARDYKNATVVKIAHKSLTAGCRCPDCQAGNLRIIDPGIVLRIVGQPWLQAHVYESERFRCNTCGKTFTARLPADIARAEKYDNTAKAIVCLLKYRGGFPFYRQESLQTMLETPISDTELWGMTRDVAMCAEPVFQTLITEAAKGQCLHNDDTKARILDLIRENKQRKEGKERTGMFTSAILSTLPDCQIALFFTGRQYAGENLDAVLDNRPEEMCIPTQVCDASNNNGLTRNKSDEGNCLGHLRRKFYELVEIWPTFALPIIFLLNTVFTNVRKAKEQELDETQTFNMHKEKSAPVMDELNRYCRSLIDDKKVEPNSNLGKAINYMFNHWDKFTLFLRKPGVPLDNNADERLIKRAVLNRKNGLFFKTEFGAHVGDILLSMIETCQLNKINPYHYLVAIQIYKDKVKKNPTLWLPWNYAETLSKQNPEPLLKDVSHQVVEEVQMTG